MTIEGLMAETGWLRRLAMGLVRDKDVADDVVQETVIIAAEQAPRDRPLRPWLHRVLLNRVRMHGRGSTRRSVRELASGDAAMPPPTPEELVVRVEIQRLLAGLVLELGEPYRAVVLLHFVEGLTSPQIAARLGIADATVRWRLKQALDELRVRLDERHQHTRAAWLVPVGDLAMRAPRTAVRATAGALIMKKLVIASLIVLAVLAGGTAWWKLRGDSSPAPVAADRWAGAPGGSGATAAIIAEKRAARAGRPVDLTPAMASGRITRAADGTGIAGAVVTLQPVEVAMMGDGEATIIAVTDATGAWAVPAVSPGNYVLGAASPGMLPAMRDGVALAAASKQGGLDLALVAGGVTVSGTVSDISGGPIGDARVRARSADGRAILKGEGAGAAYVAITGPDGHYKLTLPDGDWKAKVDQIDYTAATKRFELAGAPLTIDFTLVPGAVIHGRVVARGTGAAVPGAVVTAEVSGAFGSSGRGGGSTVADASGAFTLRGLRSGAVELTATARGVVSTAPTIVELGIAEQATNVVVGVDRAYTISGFVVRQADERTGIAGVNVGLVTLSDQASSEAVRPSAADGYFEIHGVMPGTHTLAAFGRDVMPSFGKTVVVKDADVEDVLIGLETGATLTGRVEPGAVSALSVELDPTKMSFETMFDAVKAALVTGTSDATGAFTLRNVPPAKLTLVAHTRDGRTAKLEVAVGTQDQSGLVLKLEPRASIAGRVVDPAGAPVAGVRVEAGTDKPSVMQVIDRPGAVTAADGSYRITGLPAGRATVSVVDDDGTLGWADPAHAKAPKLPIPVELAEGQARTGLVLTVEPRDAVIRGVVLGPDRTPAADVWVTARLVGGDGIRHAGGVTVIRVGTPSEGEPAPPVTTDDDDDGDEPEIRPHAPRVVLTGDDGRFTIPQLRRGTYQLTAEGKAGAVRKPDAKTGEPVTLVLEQLGTLTGVVRAGGAPAPDYSLECRSPSKTVSRRVVAADGAYTLERLPPGAYTCTAKSPIGPASGQVTVKGPTKLDLEIGAWGTITGTIVDALTGAPLAGLKLAVGGVDGVPDFEQLLGNGPQTDAAGRFEIGKQKAGAGTLVALSGGMSLMTMVVKRDYTLALGQRLDLGRIKGVAPRTGPPGTLGMTLAAAGDKLAVTAVAAGGAAAKAGVKVGDAIAAIAGKQVTELTPATAAEILDDHHVAAGQVYTLRLARGADVAVTAEPGGAGIVIPQTGDTPPGSAP